MRVSIISSSSVVIMTSALLCFSVTRAGVDGAVCSNTNRTVTDLQMHAHVSHRPRTSAPFQLHKERNTQVQEVLFTLQRLGFY